jgi:hypothetical protein
MHRSLFTRGKDPVPIVQEAEWAPWSVSTSAENLATPPTGIRSPERPACNQSLYRLRYTAHRHTWNIPQPQEFYPKRSVMEQRDLCYFENIEFPLKYISRPYLRDMKRNKGAIFTAY